MLFRKTLQGREQKFYEWLIKDRYLQEELQKERQGFIPNSGLYLYLNYFKVKK